MTVFKRFSCNLEDSPLLSFFLLQCMMMALISYYAKLENKMHEKLCLETVCIVHVELCVWVIEAIFFVCFMKVP